MRGTNAATISFVVRGPIRRADLPGLTERVCALLHAVPGGVADCYVTDVEPDLATVEALARLQLGAVRAGCRVRLCGASPDLLLLVSLMGLDDALTPSADEFRDTAASTTTTEEPALGERPKGPAMTTRDRAPLGAPCWIDLMTADPESSRDFYIQLFGWTAEEPDPMLGGYFNFRRDGLRVAGCMGTQDPNQPNLWSVYLASDDAAKTAALAGQNGGTVAAATMPVADLGTMAYLVDPSGAGIGVWQPGRHPGFTVLDEPGAPSWFELHTNDHAAAVAFYREVFGWHTVTVGDTDDFRYAVAMDGDTQVAGVMDLTSYAPRETPSAWDVYFRVADADATVTRALHLGGAVVNAPEDTPYGRLAVLTDVGGVRFRIRQM